jgi:hypothetical protein
MFKNKIKRYHVKIVVSFYFILVFGGCFIIFFWIGLFLNKKEIL